MQDIILEAANLLLLTVILARFTQVHKKSSIRKHPGWLQIYCGTSLIFAALLFDVSDNFTALNPLVIFGDTNVESFLEKVCYLSAYLFLALGFFKFLPSIDELEQSRNQLEIEKNKHQEMHLRILSVLDSLDATIYVADMDTHEVIFVNKYTKRIFGEAEGAVCWQAFHKKEEGPCDFCTNDHLLGSDGNPGKPYVWEFKNKNNGKWYHIIDRAISWVDGRIVRLEIATDISFRKRIEEKEVISRKIETAATLAGGIAHDFNNLLAVIMGYIDLEMGDSNASSSTYDNLGQAMEAAERARVLIGQFVTISSKKDPVKRVFDVKKLVSNSLEMLLSGSNVQPDYLFEQDLWSIKVDQLQINQVLKNLVTNSIEAMPKGGTISITGENVLPSDVPIEFRRVQSAVKYVKLTIQDNGVGIPVELIPNVIDPYFSTKERGVAKGMGLGLTTVYSIIDSHDGAINIDSAPDVGTTVTIYFPAVDTDLTDQVVSLSESAADSKSLNGKKVLFMDDEYMVRNMARLILEKLGCKVEVANHGDEAVLLFSRALNENMPFDAVILDLTIKGGVGGEETIKRLSQILPDVRAIVCSGYDNTWAPK